MLKLAAPLGDEEAALRTIDAALGPDRANCRGRGSGDRKARHPADAWPAIPTPRRSTWTSGWQAVRAISPPNSTGGSLRRRGRPRACCSMSTASPTWSDRPPGRRGAMGTPPNIPSPTAMIPLYADHPDADSRRADGTLRAACWCSISTTRCGAALSGDDGVEGLVPRHRLAAGRDLFGVAADGAGLPRSAASSFAFPRRTTRHRAGCVSQPSGNGAERRRTSSPSASTGMTRAANIRRSRT